MREEERREGRMGGGGGVGRATAGGEHREFSSQRGFSVVLGRVSPTALRLLGPEPLAVSCQVEEFQVLGPMRRDGPEVLPEASRSDTAALGVPWSPVTRLGRGRPWVSGGLRRVPGRRQLQGHIRYGAGLYLKEGRGPPVPLWAVRLPLCSWS